MRGEAAVGDQDAVLGQRAVRARPSAAPCRSAPRRRRGAAPPSRRHAAIRSATSAGVAGRARGLRRGERGASRSSRPGARVAPERRPSAGCSGRSPRPRCRGGSAACRAAAGCSAWSRSRRACSRRPAAVGGLDQVVGDPRVAAEEAGRERMAAGDRALAGQRVRDRDRRAPRRRPAAARRRPTGGCRRRRGSSGARAARAAPPPRRPPRASGRQRSAGTRVVRVGRQARRRRSRSVPWATSSGTSSTTGPGRPEVATLKARRTSSGIRGVRSIRITSLTAGRRISSCRLSWVMFFQECVAVAVADERDHRRAGVQRLDQRGHEVGRAGAERGVAHARPGR